MSPGRNLSRKFLSFDLLKVQFFISKKLIFVYGHLKYGLAEIRRFSAIREAYILIRENYFSLDNVCIFLYFNFIFANL